MGHVFLSYASADRERARRLAVAMQGKGYQVWWDREIAPGQTFDDAIEEALTSATCVVVLWSSASVNSNWVKTEASEAAGRKILVPALIDAVRIPLEFRRVQAADLTQWDGNAESVEFKQFLRAVDLELQNNLQPGPSEHAEPAGLQSESLVGSATRAGRWRGASWTLAALLGLVVIAGLTFWLRRDTRAVATEKWQTILEDAARELTPFVQGAAARETTGRCSEDLTASGPPDMGFWTTAQCALALMTGSDRSAAQVLRGLEFLSAPHDGSPWTIESTTWPGMAFLGALAHPSLRQGAGAGNADWIGQVRRAYDEVSARQSGDGGWGSYKTTYVNAHAMTAYATYTALQFLLEIKKSKPYSLDEAALDGRINNALRWILQQYDDKTRGWSEPDSAVKPQKDLATLYLIVLTGAAQAGFDQVAKNRNYEAALGDWITTTVADSQSRTVTENSQLRQTQYIFDEHSEKPVSTKGQAVTLLWFPWSLWLSDVLAADKHLSVSRKRQIDVLEERLIQRLPEVVDAFKTGSTYPAAELLYVVSLLRQQHSRGLHVDAAGK